MLDKLLTTIAGREVIMERRVDGWYSWVQLSNTFFPVEYEPQPTLAEALARNIHIITTTVLK